MKINISEVNEFFKEYAQSYLAFDAGKLVKFFNFPNLIHDTSGVHYLQNADDLNTYEKIFLEKLKSQNIVKIIHKILEHDSSQQLPNAVGCKIAYKLFDINNQLITDFDYTYSLVKTDAWKILFARLGEVRKYE